MHSYADPWPSTTPVPQDALRPDAAATVAELHAAGLRTVMLSGDREAAAREVAGAVGIGPQDVYANVKPAGGWLRQLITYMRMWWRA